MSDPNGMVGANFPANTIAQESIFQGIDFGTLFALRVCRRNTADSNIERLGLR